MMIAITTSTISGLNPYKLARVPPHFNSDMNSAEKMIPIGFEAPSKATAIPSKPSPAIMLIGSYVIELPAIVEGARIANAPAIPARPPAITIVRTIFFLPFIPAYSAPCLLKPVALNSYPKVVLYKTIYKATAIRIAIIIATLTLEPVMPKEGTQF